MPYATVNGVELHYQFEGIGPEAIVLVNGLADDLDTWVGQSEAFLKAGYRVLRFDNRGVGRSAMPVGPYTTRMMAEDTKALVNEVGINNFHLLGISMGGMVAQEYGIAYGADLKSVGLACTYAAPGPFCSRMYSMWADMAPILGVPFVMRDVTLWAFTTDLFESRTTDLKEFETAMRFLNQPTAAYLSQLSAIQTHDASDRLGEIAVPTLVVAGEEDILIPVHLPKQLYQAIPGASWAVTKGGHACIWEYPEEFNQTYLNFIDTLGGDRHG
jgi:pimeloyl-ACP methyl ester carboxylesterase